MNITPLIFGLIFAVIGFLTVVIFLLSRYAKRKRLKRELNTRLLLVKLPQGQPGEKKDVLSEIARSEQLIVSLAKNDTPFMAEVAVHNVGEEISFYIAVAEQVVQSAMRQIEGLWPGAQVGVAAEDYTVFNSEGTVSMAVVRQKSSFVLPIRTYADAGLDTFATILNNFTKIQALGEGLALQVAVVPASKESKKKINGIIYKLKKGEKLNDIIASGLKSIFVTKEKIPETQPKIIDEEAVKMLEQKNSKPLFAVNIRLVASAPTPYRTAELLEGLADAFSQFVSPRGNEFKLAKLGDSRKALFKFIFREFDYDEAIILNSAEIGSVFHFPISTTEIPHVKIVKSKEAPPPVNLPQKGTILGESVFRGEVRPVFIGDDDRRRHLYIIGQTGTGKSGLIHHVAVEDINNGKGVAILDPHGDLIDAILGSVPKHRYKDVIIFDPGDRLSPLGLNMLEYDPNYPEQKTFIVNELLNIFDKLYDLKTTGGPMFEQYMRGALLLLMEGSRGSATLMDVPRVFTDIDFRRELLDNCTNPVVIDFWEKEAVKAGGDAALQNMTPYVTSKFNNFIANDYMRPIISQTKSAFNFREVMDSGKILLVNLSKGRIGESNASLLGMIVVGKILMAALSRVDIPQEKRRDFNLYIDEFQNFTTDSISTILSEARKYRLNLVMAHQFIAQLAEKIKGAVFGNVGSIIAFRVGPEDADFLVKQFEPVFGKNDLINLNNRNACVRLLVDGQTAPPFSMRTIEAPSGSSDVREGLKELSRKVYGMKNE